MIDRDLSKRFLPHQGTPGVRIDERGVIYPPEEMKMVPFCFVPGSPVRINTGNLCGICYTYEGEHGIRLFYSAEGLSECFHPRNDPDRVLRSELLDALGVKGKDVKLQTATPRKFGSLGEVTNPDKVEPVKIGNFATSQMSNKSKWGGKIFEPKNADAIIAYASDTTLTCVPGDCSVISGFVNVPHQKKVIFIAHAGKDSLAHGVVSRMFAKVARLTNEMGGDASHVFTYISPGVHEGQYFHPQPYYAQTGRPNHWSSNSDLCGLTDAEAFRYPAMTALVLRQMYWGLNKLRGGRNPVTVSPFTTNKLKASNSGGYPTGRILVGIGPKA